MPPIGSLLLALALLFIVGLFVLRPLLRTQPAQRQAAVNARQALEAEKNALLAQIRNLDFDYETGTMLETEHQQLRQELVTAAAAVLQELDELEPVAPGTPGQVDEIEAAIAQRRSQRATVDIEAAVAQRRARPQTIASTGNGSGVVPAVLAFCPQCGKSTERGDRFCAYCGHQLD